MSDAHHPHHLLPSEPRLKLRALETILKQKGLISEAALAEIVETYSHKIGPQRGAHVVARAWRERGFKKRLLEDTDALLGEMGLRGRQGEHVVVVENTDAVHNLVVCTLCSCYPWPLLGIPPAWYKSDAYRSRAVSEPRRVLAEFGLIVPAGKKIRVFDSTAEIRYLVLPQPPPEACGLPLETLERWVSRNAMIGVALPASPAPAEEGDDD